MTSVEQPGPAFYRHIKALFFGGIFPQLSLPGARFLLFFSVSVYLFFPVCHCSGEESFKEKIQAIRVHIPKKIGKIDAIRIPEVSGIIKSKKHENTFWVHGDSGRKAALFAITESGVSQIEGGINLPPDVVNKDWEDIAQDCSGNIYIGDFGNNKSSRTDLSIIIIREPELNRKEPLSSVRQIYFRYPDQKKFPAKIKNFDAEALFWSGGSLYLYTKHRMGNDTKLYRFPTLDPGSSFITLEYIETFPIQGMVTAADSDCSGGRRVVLTYSGVWLFEESGSVYYLPIFAGQCEGVCIDGENIFITNEKGEIFLLSTADLKQLR